MTATRPGDDPTLHPSKGYGYGLIAEALADLIGHEKATHYPPANVFQAGRAAWPYTVGDLVDRADSTATLGTATSGTAWSGTALQVTSNRIVAVNPVQFGAARASIQANLADGEFGLTLAVVDTASNGGLIFRWIDSNNFCVFWQSGTGYTLTTLIGGVSSSSYFTITEPAPANGDRIKVIARGTLILCYVNDVFVGYANPGTVNTTGTLIGIQTGSVNTKFVDLYARRLPA